MNSFIPWVGGKSKLLWIINKMAPDHYSRFIDVFGGSGTVTMSRPIQPGCMEVYNDFNSNLIPKQRKGADRYGSYEYESGAV